MLLIILEVSLINFRLIKGNFKIVTNSQPRRTRSAITTQPQQTKSISVKEYLGQV